MKTKGFTQQQEQLRRSHRQRMLLRLLMVAWVVIGSLNVQSVWAISSPWNGTVAGSFGGGNGTAAYPYQIYTAEQLARVTQYCGSANTHFILMDDLDLGGIDYGNWNWGGKSWTPIANGVSFNGKFNGNGKRIYNFYISGSSEFRGLFSTVGDGGYVRDITIVNGRINNGGSSGGIASTNHGLIEHCRNEGVLIQVMGGDGGKIGGICGWNSPNGVIRYCTNKATVNGIINGGGICGWGQGGGNGAIYGCVNRATSMSTNTRHSGIIGTNGYRIYGNYSTYAGIGEVKDGRSNFTSLGTTAQMRRIVEEMNQAIRYICEKFPSPIATRRMIMNVPSSPTGEITFSEMTNLFPYDPGNRAPTKITWVDRRQAPTVGNGTASNPYLIDKEEHLAYLMNTNVGADKHYRLTKDLDMKAYVGRPLFWYNNLFFTGTFDGQNHTIRNLFIDIDGSDWGRTGFVSLMKDNAEVRDLRIENLQLNSNTIFGTLNPKGIVGGIVGELQGNAKITNCHIVGGEVWGTTNVGGLVGRMSGNSLVRNCSAIDVNVFGGGGEPNSWNWDDATGGVVGDAISGRLDNVLYKGEVNTVYMGKGWSGYNRTGGVVGLLEASSPTAFVMNNVVTFATYAGNETLSMGGIVGKCTSGAIPSMSGVFWLNNPKLTTACLDRNWGNPGTNGHNQFTMFDYTWAKTPYRINEQTSAGTSPETSNKVWGYENGHLAIVGHARQTIQIENQSYITSFKSSYQTWSNMGVTAQVWAAMGDKVEITAVDGSLQNMPLVASSLKGLPSGVTATSIGFNKLEVTINQPGNFPLTVNYKQMPYVVKNDNVIASVPPEVRYNGYAKSATITWQVGNEKNTGSLVEPGTPPGNWLIFRREEGATAWGAPIVKINVATATSWTDTSVEVGKKYQYCVQWCDEFQDSNSLILAQATAPSSTVNVTLDYDMAAVAIPSESAIKIRFNYPDNEAFNGAAYKIYKEGITQPIASGTLSTGTSGAMKEMSYTEEGILDACNDLTYYVLIDGFSDTSPLKGLSFKSPYIITKPTGTYAFKPDYTVGKGESATTIKLAWSVDKVAAAEVKYVIRRKQAETSDTDYQTIKEIVSSDKSFMWEDQQVVPGICYDYRIELQTRCGSGTAEFTYTTHIEDIGFCQSKGTISGKISYGSGTTVQGVNVVMRRAGLESGQTQYKSLSFTGAPTQTKWYMGAKKEKELFDKANYTMQFYLNPSASNTDEKGVWNLFHHTQLSLVRQAAGDYKLKVTFANGNASLLSDFAIPGNKFHHITVKRQGNEFTIARVNADTLAKPKIEATTITLSKTDLCSFESVPDTLLDQTIPALQSGYYLQLGNGMVGNIDEMRIWKKALTNDEIVNAYDRMLMGSESGLVAYWSFDEGLSKRFFDASKNNGLINGNHGYIEYYEQESNRTTMVSTIVPTEDQLALKSKTDNNGNYVITGVPFTGDGSLYSIVPTHGTHKFDPQQEQRFVGAGSMIHNGTNFRDISSFTLKGYVYYKDTEFPVEGASFAVDGLICSRDNRIITTNTNGYYEIDVPIGVHKVTIGMQDHVFANNGAMLINGNTSYDFQENTAYNGFVDETLVNVVGRVVGGRMEGDKEIGFARSVANIGQADLVFKTVSDKYYLNQSSSESRVIPGSRKGLQNYTEIKSSASVDPRSGTIRVKTDPKTGEFFFSVPPVSLVLNSMVVKKQDGSVFISEEQFQNVKDKTPVMNLSATGNKYYCDSISNIEVDSLRYAQSLNLVYRTPNIRFDIFDLDAATNMYGDSTYVYTNPTTAKNDTIQLYDSKEGTYKFGYPVFSMNKPYNFGIRAYEKYDHPAGEFADKSEVPCIGGKVTFVNDMGRMSYSIPDGSVSEPTTQSIDLNEKGVGVYAFVAGFPNLTAPFTYGLSAVLDIEGMQYPWRAASNPFKGIVSGNRPLGTGFVTSGPAKVDFVLRDPPGTNSYTYIEKGTKKSSTYSYTGRFNEATGVNTRSYFGAKVELASGTPFLMNITQVEATATLDAGFEQTMVRNNTNSWTETITTTERIQTSDSPDFVGADADVYVGNSTNIYYGLSQELGFKPDNSNPSNYNLDVYETYIMSFTNDPIGFRYTQGHILNELIPNLIKLRNDLITVVPIGEYEAPGSYAKTVYLSSIQKTDPNFGTKGYYKMVVPTGTIIESDQVMEYNQHVKNWQERIEDNEKEKVDAYGGSDVFKKQNFSFDAGAILENSMDVATIYSETSDAQFDLNVTTSTESGFQVNGVGVMVNPKLMLGGGYTRDWADAYEDNTTYGYVLADENAGNYFSVDVFSTKKYDEAKKSDDIQSMQGKKDNPDFDHSSSHLLFAKNFSSTGSPIFFTRGGVSSCPYEGTHTSLFYKKNGQFQTLGFATIPMEVPQILLNEKQLSNVPNGKDGTITMQLSNTSSASVASWFNLYLDEKSNPDGLILSIDGLPLTSAGRAFQLLPGQSLSKTMTVRQSNTGIMEYKDIRLILASQCDEQVLDSMAVFNVSYQPACSEITMTIPNRIVNAETPNKELSLTLTGYDLNYKNLDGIQLLYRNAADMTANGWRTAKGYVITRNPGNEDSELIDKRTTLNITFPMVALPDGTYEFYARTLCNAAGNSYIYTETETVSVIKDVSTPMVLGNASPSNGILTPENEVSITFNEAIQTGKLKQQNFSAQGQLNGAVTDNNIGLVFDGNVTTATEFPLNFQNASFTMEGWFKPELANATAFGELFRIGGDGSNSIALKVKGNDLAVVAGGNTIAKKPSAALTLNNTWHYFAVSYNSQSKELTAIIIDDYITTPAAQEVLKTTLTDPLSITGRLELGKGFKGQMSRLSAWTEYRNDPVLISRDKYNMLTGRENNLAGYWQLDEGQGAIAYDKARSRNLNVKGNWYIYPLGRSVTTNGTTQHVSLPLATGGFGPQSDFTVQFWFKAGADQNSKTLFSMGDGVSDKEPQKKLSVSTSASGELELRHNKLTYTVPGVVTDDAWHQFTLSVKRGGASNLYLDGVIKYQLVASNVAQLESGEIVLGARKYTADAVNYTIDRRFKGAFDEVRLWNSALSSELIRMDMNNKLKGTEVGLTDCYPFEAYVDNSGTMTVNNSLTNTAKAEKEGAYYVNNSSVPLNSAAASFSTATPTMKDVRPVQDLSTYITYTASANKIVVNVDPYILNMTEGQIIEFGLKDVLDVNGNFMESPVKWSAFINMNRLKWATEKVVINKEVLVGHSFKATISNTSGKNINWVISGIPGWLSLSKTAGSIAPMDKVEITCTVDKATNIGSYECALNLTSTDNTALIETLPIMLTVTGERPDWRVNPAEFETSMNLVGAVTIEGVYQEDSEDLVAAFIGNKCVGVGSPRYVAGRNSYYLFLDIYGNGANAENDITFSLWDASTGRIYPDLTVSTGKVSFAVNTTVGSVNSPALLNALDRIEQTIELSAGWNRISIHVENSGKDDIRNIDQFKANMENAGVQLKNATSFLVYNTGNWGGTLDAIDVTQGYLLKTSRAHTLKITGKMAKAAEHPITLKSGWNWIGYIPQFPASPQDAFAGLVVEEGDQVKTQKGFAIYTSNQWIGSLDYLKPGEGYLFRSASASNRTFNYPVQSRTTGAQGYRSLEYNAQKSVEPKWEANVSAFENNMTLVAVATVEGHELTNGSWELAAFNGDQCRGRVLLQNCEPFNRLFAFLTISGVDGEKMQFKLYDHETGEEYHSASLNNITYLTNDMKGMPNEPYVISFGGPTSVNGVHTAKGSVYPTRVKSEVTIDYPLDEIIRVEVLDNAGSQLMMQKSMSSKTLNLDNLVDGVYFIRVTLKEGVRTHRIIKEPQ